MQKTRLSEAAETAKELVHMYKSTTIVDTILCLDGTQVIGTCMANELTKDGFRNMNAHQTIYIITPEYTSGSQIILRDNIAPMVRGRHVLILSASITTGYSIKAAVEAVQYYGGQVAGLAAIFATTHEFMGMRVNSIFDPNNLPDYQSYESRGLPHVQSRPAHRRFGEQLRLFLPVIIQNFFRSDLPDRGLLSPLSSRGLFAPADRKRPPVTRGAMVFMYENPLRQRNLDGKNPIVNPVWVFHFITTHAVGHAQTVFAVYSLSERAVRCQNQRCHKLFSGIDRSHFCDFVFVCTELGCDTAAAKACFQLIRLNDLNQTCRNIGRQNTQAAQFLLLKIANKLPIPSF